MFLRYIILAIVFFIKVAHAMEEKKAYEFKCATRDDVAKLLEFFNEKVAVGDNFDRIVVLPPHFRKQALESAVEKKRLFIASYESLIVGMQKIFVVNNCEELEGILRDEIRCKDTMPFACGSLDFANNHVQHYDPSECSFSENDTYIYNGSSFTDLNHRGKGINAQLSSFALHHSAGSALDHIEKYQSKNLIMLFGLVHANAGEFSDLLGGRSLHVVNQFKEFVKENRFSSTLMSLYRYPAYMPKFDQESEECIPLSDTQSVPGFGCVVSYPLHKY